MPYPLCLNLKSTGKAYKRRNYKFVDYEGDMDSSIMRESLKKVERGIMKAG
jgi:hypothetical protein